MARPTCLLVSLPNAMNDPPPRNAAESLRDAGYAVTVVTHVPPSAVRSTVPGGIVVREAGSSAWYTRLGKVGRVLRWQAFRSAVHRAVRDTQPDLVVAIMFHAITALPERVFTSAKTVACIYDVPPLEDAGRFDRHIIRAAWDRLVRFNAVWASDSYRGAWAQRYGRLPTAPLTCLNCPSLSYMPDTLWPRDAWLRQELRRQGATIGETGGCVLLRAGAIGPCGGIEETMAAMSHLPDDFVFLMMGRPGAEYAAELRQQIATAGLGRRFFFWDRPTDAVWDQALRGADIGHMVHGPFPPGPWQRHHEHNSSLSNNRLYNYMAAGLPIVLHADSRMTELTASVPCFRTARHESLEPDLLAIYRELGTDAVLREQLGRAGRVAHRERYNWPAQFAPVLDRVRPASAEGS